MTELVCLQIVSFQIYSTELEKLGINVKAKNFLVFQGAVESIATKSPKEITALFEEISGSVALKEDYERLKAEVSKAEETVQLFLQKKKAINVEKKEARMEKEEAEKYRKLCEELAERKLIFCMFKLYNCEQNIKSMRSEIARKQSEFKDIRKRKEKTEELVNEKKIELIRIGKELAK